MDTSAYKGRRIHFQKGPDHESCWHTKTGMESGVVLRPAPTMAQKADLLAADGILIPDLTDLAAEFPRLWVKVDPCPRFPRGCETAVDVECVIVT
jgi:hypothetical protein